MSQYLDNKIVQEMEDYIKDYVLENEDSFKDAAIARHNYDDNYRMNNYQKDVERDFITKINPTITLDTLNLRYRINREDFYYDKSLFEEYLFEPEKTIEKYSKIMMEKDKADLGVNLLCYEAKKEYLEKSSTLLDAQSIRAKRNELAIRGLVVQAADVPAEGFIQRLASSTVPRHLDRVADSPFHLA